MRARWYLTVLLIAPEGIEMKIVPPLRAVPILLLIAPEGIEMICIMQLMQLIKELLIAPEGIEISDNELHTRRG